MDKASYPSWPLRNTKILLTGERSEFGNLTRRQVVQPRPNRNWKLRTDKLRKRPFLTSVLPFWHAACQCSLPVSLPYPHFSIVCYPWTLSFANTSSFFSPTPLLTEALPKSVVLYPTHIGTRWGALKKICLGIPTQKFWSNWSVCWFLFSALLDNSIV